MNIGETVRDWRTRHKIQQSDFAVAIGVSQPHMSDFERGKKMLGEASALMLQRVTFGEIKASECVNARSGAIVAELDGSATIAEAETKGAA